MRSAVSAWIEVGGPRFARLPEHIRAALLARAWVSLLVLALVLELDGPEEAGFVYAMRYSGHIRVSGPGIWVWTGP